MIGVCGQTNAGKRTVAAMLCARDERRARRALADPLKDFLCDAFATDRDELDWYAARPRTNHPTMMMPARRALQTVGEAMRQVHPDVWVTRALVDAPAHAVITDVRHVNEMEAIRRRGGRLVLIGRTAACTTDPHPSERTLADAVGWFLRHTRGALVVVRETPIVPRMYHVFSYFVRNDGTVADLTDAIAALDAHAASCAGE